MCSDVEFKLWVGVVAHFAVPTLEWLGEGMLLDVVNQTDVDVKCHTTITTLERLLVLLQRDQHRTRLLVCLLHDHSLCCVWRC